MAEKPKHRVLLLLLNAVPRGAVVTLTTLEEREIVVVSVHSDDRRILEMTAEIPEKGWYESGTNFVKTIVGRAPKEPANRATLCITSGMSTRPCKTWVSRAHE